MTHWRIVINESHVQVKGIIKVDFLSLLFLATNKFFSKGRVYQNKNAITIHPNYKSEDDISEFHFKTYHSIAKCMQSLSNRI